MGMTDTEQDPWPQAALPDWEPMATAPKDVDILLIVPGTGSPVVGRWRPDSYSKTPRPYWGHDRESLFGTRATRQNPPTHWMPLPAGPHGD